MNNIRTIKGGGNLKGNIKVPGDKSISHRALIIGSIAHGETTVEGFLHSEDPLSTADCLRKLGANIPIIKKDEPFSISGLGFYNYPYLFGYLFSLGLYSHKDSESFANTYNKVLRDTGKMTAEELVSKYLGRNIEENTFWDNGINIVSNSINCLEDLLKK